MSHADEFEQRVRSKVAKDIYMENDGYYVYWPKENNGFWESWALRIVADLLDEMNAEWDKQVQADLEMYALRDKEREWHKKLLADLEAQKSVSNPPCKWCGQTFACLCVPGEH